ncbi:MAG: AAA family ATPase [Nitrospirae bacterium]|nr:AAA family ATPase [Nitrospirota bacterium]
MEELSKDQRITETMYNEHFGLNMLPFEHVPDPIFFFNDGEYALIRNRIVEYLTIGQGVTVIIGPNGAGKTALSQVIKSDIPPNINTICMAMPPRNSTDLFNLIDQELGLPPSTKKVFDIKNIEAALLQIKSGGGKCLLIIDDAHLMSADTLNGVRVLANLDSDSTKLIQLFLLGQEGLIDIVNRLEMKPFKQHIAVMELFGRINGSRIRKYILHRIQIAGGQPSIFTDAGWDALVLALSSGTGRLPHIINLLCDRSLSAAFEKGKQAVDVDDVYEAAKGMKLHKDVFYNKFMLKQKAKEKQAASAATDSVSTHEMTVKASESGISSDMTGRQHEQLQPETPQLLYADTADKDMGPEIHEPAHDDTWFHETRLEMPEPAQPEMWYADEIHQPDHDDDRHINIKPVITAPAQADAAPAEVLPEMTQPVQPDIEHQDMQPEVLGPTHAEETPENTEPMAAEPAPEETSPAAELHVTHQPLHAEIDIKPEIPEPIHVDSVHEEIKPKEENAVPFDLQPEVFLLALADKGHEDIKPELRQPDKDDTTSADIEEMVPEDVHMYIYIDADQSDIQPVTAAPAPATAPQPMQIVSEHADIQPEILEPPKTDETLIDIVPEKHQPVQHDIEHAGIQPELPQPVQLDAEAEDIKPEILRSFTKDVDKDLSVHETSQKSFIGQGLIFLRMFLGKKDKGHAEREGSARSYDKLDADTAKELGMFDNGSKQPLDTGDTAVKPDEIVIIDDIQPIVPETPVVKTEETYEAGQPGHLSEWVTIDKEGKRSFMADPGKDMEPRDKETTPVPSEIKELNKFEIPDLGHKESQVSSQEAHSSEWLVINSKGIQAFKPAPAGNIKRQDIKEKPESKFDEWESVAPKKTSEFEIPDARDKKSQDEAQTESSSEWLTIDAKGAQAFRPAPGKEKRLPDKKDGLELKFDEWETTSAKKTGGFEIPDARDKKSEGSAKTGPSSEWLSVNAKGAKPLEPPVNKEKKPKKKEKSAAKPDDWIRVRPKEKNMAADNNKKRE